MINSIIKFKATNKGLLVIIEGDDIEDIREELDKRINKTVGFYQEFKFLGVESQSLTREQILELSLELKYEYKFDIILKDIINKVFHSNNEESDKVDEQTSEAFVSKIIQKTTKFIYGAVRSGQEIEYEGHVVVIGDVNSGAVLKAGGNVVVLGNLRGIVHAGLGGDINSTITAFKLYETQFKICDITGSTYDILDIKYKTPQIVKIINKKLAIKPYLPNK